MTSNTVITDKLDKMSLENRNKLKNSIFQTKRTKLHENRKQINEKINKELRMKSGAKNLSELTKDKKIKSKINIEIDYFESNLKLWKEELDRMNCSLDTYQNMKSALPMIPLSMKNTIDIDFKNSFRNIISSHYGENPDEYKDAINIINEKRKAISSPRRTAVGVQDHISYYKLIAVLERRFFFTDRTNEIIFAWNDILTGIPYMQRTVIFEKSGVIFNLASLFTQLAAATDKTTKSGLEEAQMFFLKAEACFSHLNTNFVNAPSVDLKPEILLMQSGVMRAQAMECKFLLLKSVRINEDQGTNTKTLEVVRESLAVSNLFDNIYGSLNVKLLPFLEYLPHTWITLVQVKASYYKALAYQVLADRYMAISQTKDARQNEIIDNLGKELVGFIKPSKYHMQLPSNTIEAVGFAKLLINESLQMAEECVKLTSMNSYLRNLDDLTSFLQSQHNSWLNKLHQLNSLESYDLLSCPELYISHRIDSVDPVYFQEIISAQVNIDPFKMLGPIETFNTHVKITNIRTITVHRDQKSGFGFTVKGDAPVKVVDVDKGSNAEKNGLKVGDVILSIDQKDMKWASQDTLMQHTSSCSKIKLRVASITENSLIRNNTTSFDALSLLSAQPDNNFLSLPSRKTGKMTWKQRISSTWRKKKAKSEHPQVSSTIF